VCGGSRTHGDNGGDGETDLEVPRPVPTHSDEDFGLEDLMQALGRLELNALGRVTHGDVPQGEYTR
jgi:hypothetical protein